MGVPGQSRDAMIMWANGYKTRGPVQLTPTPVLFLVTPTNGRGWLWRVLAKVWGWVGHSCIHVLVIAVAIPKLHDRYERRSGFPRYCRWAFAWLLCSSIYKDGFYSGRHELIHSFPLGFWYEFLSLSLSIYIYICVCVCVCVCVSI